MISFHFFFEIHKEQEELLNKLGHYGVTATQATISRDIR
ncbi:hypothetical protein GHI11_14035, partial [Enterococcus faecium]|nr:hypothetical protein [Enterococcus faecium]